MSNFDNGGLGDGGLQKAKETILDDYQKVVGELNKYGITNESVAKLKAKFDEHHIDIEAEWDSLPDELRRPEHRRDHMYLIVRNRMEKLMKKG